MCKGWHTLQGVKGGLEADNITYNPTVATDWDALPSKVGPALDELADRVEAEENETTYQERQTFSGTKGMGWSALSCREDGWAPINPRTVPALILSLPYEKKTANTAAANTHIGKFTIPGGIMGAKGCLVVEWVLCLTNGTGSDDAPTISVLNQGGVCYVAPFSVDTGDNSFLRFKLHMGNRDNTASQFVWVSVDYKTDMADISQPGSTAALSDACWGVESTVDTTEAHTIYIYSAWSDNDTDKFKELFFAECRIYAHG